jgi:DNA-directed RNA polymerase specialized sigma24 family protein
MVDKVPSEEGARSTSRPDDAPQAERRAKSGSLTEDGLRRLLSLLDEDPDAAGQKYEHIRHKLIRLFEWRGYAFPEDLADKTIDRVARKLEGGLEIEAEDPYPYFCSVAFLVFKEVLREQRRERQALARGQGQYMATLEPVEPEEPNVLLDPLRYCLDRLPEADRRLILEYHRGEKRPRIENRKRLTEALGLSENALRIRTYRIRLRLARCIEESRGDEAK